MNKDWIIKSFISERGGDVIEEWLANFSNDIKAEIETRLKYIKTLPILKRPYAKKLTGSKYIFEIIIKYKNVQYRPLGFINPAAHEFILLIGAIEKGDKFEPRGALEIAERRRQQFLEGRNNAREYFL
jgi:hypothetical protein